MRTVPPVAGVMETIANHTNTRTHTFRHRGEIRLPDLFGIRVFVALVLLTGRPTVRVVEAKIRPSVPGKLELAAKTTEQEMAYTNTLARANTKRIKYVARHYIRF